MTETVMDADRDKDLDAAVENFNRLKNGAAKPQGRMRRVVARDSFGRIDAVIDTPVTLEDPATPVTKSGESTAIQAATAAVKVATELVKESKAQAQVTAQELSSTVAKAVADQAVAIATNALEEVIEDMVADATEGLDFKRKDDEDPDEVEDGDLKPVFRTKVATKAHQEQELIAAIDKGLAPLIVRLAKMTEIMDGVNYVVNAFDGNMDHIQAFFTCMKNKPQTDIDHPFLNDPHLRVFAFPGSDESAGRLSNETSSEYDEDEYPAEDNAHMRLGKPRRKQPLHDELRSENGSENFDQHKAPQADAVLMAEKPEAPLHVQRERARRWRKRR